jgi:hypothetical protein
MVTTFVAEDDGRIIAFVSVSVADERASLLVPLRYGKIGSNLRDGGAPWRRHRP